MALRTELRITTGAPRKTQRANLRITAEPGRGFDRIQFMGEHTETSVRFEHIGVVWVL